MFFNVKAPIWLISLLETSSIYICLPGVKVGKVTVQPFISSIHKPASELSVAALQLMFTHFRNERLFYHKKIINNTMSKLKYCQLFFWLNCYE